jgi:hypothetical protein
MRLQNRRGRPRARAASELLVRPISTSSSLIGGYGFDTNVEARRTDEPDETYGATYIWVLAHARNGFCGCRPRNSGAGHAAATRNPAF